MGQSIVLFGGGGFVGGNLATIAIRQGWEVHVADRAVYAGIQGARWHELSVTDEEAVGRLLGEVRPSAVVNLAAVADIDRAEREPELARAVNVDAARIIASSCARAGSWCLYFSSDAVFDGSGSMYTEGDPPHPVNHYGRTKAEGEAAVLQADSAAAIVRVSLALGFPVTGGNSFFAALEARLKRGEEITAPVDEVRTPVDVLTLSSCVLELALLRYSGVIHIGSTDSMDRAAITRRAAALMGFPEARVRSQPAPAAPATPRAARHKNGIISVAKAQGLLKTPLLDVERSIRRAVEERLA